MANEPPFNSRLDDAVKAMWVALHVSRLHLPESVADDIEARFGTVVNEIDGDDQ
jgi:hypothetical protein